MEEVNKMDLWDCVDEAVLDMGIMLNGFKLLECYLDDLFAKNEELSGYAHEQLDMCSCLCYIIRNGFKVISDNLEKGLHDDT